MKNRFCLWSLKKVLTIISFILFKLSIAQVTVTYSSAIQAVNSLAGQGIQIIPNSITYTGNTSINQSTGLLVNKQLGIFNDPNSLIGVSNGIVLSTGDVIDVPQDNSFSNTKAFARSGDPDLSKLSSPRSTHDAAILEFDFKPGAASVSFEFIFASDEYTEHLSNGYFDAFGLFISGQGISPDLDINSQPMFLNGAKNLALVPNTSSPITAGTINPFNGNSQFYVSGSQSIEFDGYTTVLTATIGGLTCDGTATYHLKIAIADVQDENVDAWVVLNSKSLATEMFVGDISTIPPLCEGQSFNISIVGDLSYNYLWSTGGSGRSTTFIPSQSMTEISVVVTDPISGCVITKTKAIETVHSNQNNQPTCGVLYDIDGSPVTELFVKIGETFCKELFFHPPENDEIVFLSINNAPIGIGMNLVGNNTNSPKLQICWTPQAIDIGQHCFSVTASDNNACEVKSSECEYCIKVICPACQYDVYYENRSIPVSNPLPAETVAGRKIVAGYDVLPVANNGDVIVSASEQVSFRAGESILLKDGFFAQSGSNFKAEINPNTCTNIEDCNCCTNWPGFSSILIPNVITPNGDGYNDYWGVIDYANPNCAYRAQCFELEIYDRGVPIYSRNGKGGCPCTNTMDCCPFRSPSGPFDQSKPSIFWDATSDITGNKVPDAVYFYIIKLCSPCGETVSYTGFIEVIDSDWLEPPAEGEEDDSIASQIAIKKDSITMNTTSSLLVYPNPSHGSFNLIYNSKHVHSSKFEVINSAGIEVFNGYIVNNRIHNLDLNGYPKGMYLIKLFASDNSVLLKKVIIQ